jgi:hypothetical protein
MSLEKKYLHAILIGLVSLTLAYIGGNFIEQESMPLRALYAGLGATIGAGIGIFIIKRFKN